VIVDHPLRVVIFDRALTNDYSTGLAAGLERLGTRPILAGPARDPHPGVVAVYPRSGIRGAKAVKLADSVAAVFHLARLVAGCRPDVLHFQWATFPNYAIARVLKPLTRASLVFTVHNPAPRDSHYRWQRSMARIADALIVHGPRLRDDLIRLLEVPVERVHVIPHGNYEHAIVRYDRTEARHRLGLPTDGPVFTFVGQLQERKGLDTLVEAFRLHCERGMPGMLVIAGPAYGVDVSELRRRIEPYGERVRWMTRAHGLPAELLDLAVSAATQVVLPFHEATQSGSLLFSMTHGRCIVTSDVGEVPATVGDRGVVVPPRDAAALAEALELAVRDPAACDRLGAAARAYVVSEFDWCRVAALTLRVYGATRDDPLAPAQFGTELVCNTTDEEPVELVGFQATRRTPTRRTP
jgi:glycosyltransferase involved in cell wall biosynthesis